MGQYHTRFTDLPLSLCEELVRMRVRPLRSDVDGGVARGGCAAETNQVVGLHPRLRSGLCAA